MTNKFEPTSFLYGSNAVFVEELYQLYLQNPGSIDPSWQDFFRNFTEKQEAKVRSTAKIILPQEKKVEDLVKNGTAISSTLENSLKAKFMIAAYRQRGHYLSNLDPLGLEKLKTKKELKLDLEDFGFTAEQLDENIDVNQEFSGLSSCSLSELKTLLEQTYSNSMASEFNHIENNEEQKWLFDRIENAHVNNNFSSEEKKNILKELVEVEGFEQYLHTKFVGAKRFSVEGGDSSILATNKIIEISADYGVIDIVLGMAHRGRLCTLTQVMKKPYRAVLSEFMGSSAFPNELDIAGDVKYHMGYSSDQVTPKGNKVHLSLTPNPSHLEAVNPVVSGKVRAKQDFINDSERKKVLGILIHGDAAFCGQGVVAENLVMSGLKPYDVAGIIHFVINNQIGFTANSFDTRPGRYATEVAKMVSAPIMHVNGDDIESVLIATKIAADYRQKFGKDVVLDIVCYRKYGHNEGDEPMYTQGEMYNVIKNKHSPAAIYAKLLINSGVIGADYLDNLRKEFKSSLDLEYEEAKSYKPQAQWLEGMWAGYARSDNTNTPTGVKKSLLKELGLKLCNIPKDFPLNSKLAKLFEHRIETLRQDASIDWATGEQLAFATLLNEEIPIRLTGQDCGRGTFSHRHSVLHSQIDSSYYIPLNNLSKKQALYFVADSNLSEYGVLGFEYGYSLVNPKHLVMWEAQFGDFANGAQIIFDQFIVSSETKWLRMSGLVVLLPHGFEGQGPEHSSARLERFLQLAAEENIQVAYPTTPASLFHLLRRQIHRTIRKPLIVMTPKSLLRHKMAVSNLSELDEGTYFLPVLDEVNNNINASNVKRVIFCSGKIYYDILEKRTASKINDIVIIRLEQLYPFDKDMVVKIMKKYNNAKELVWCQEEPKNMGSWNFVHSYFAECQKIAKINSELLYIGRLEAASPASGYLYTHNKQQEILVKEALKLVE